MLESSPETSDSEHGVEYWRTSALHQAVLARDADQLTSLLEGGESINILVNGRTPLHLACQIGATEAAKLLIKHRCDVNAIGVEGYTTFSPLHVASSAGHDEIVSLLLQHSADPNSAADTASPLRMAAQHGHASIVHTLLHHGADVDGSTVQAAALSPLAVAAINGHLEIQRHLLASGSDVNHQDFAGSTALFHAAKNNQRDACCLLVDHGADTNIANNAGEYPLNIAAMFGNAAIVDILLRGGSQVDVIGAGSRETPLCSAIVRQHLQVVKQLIEAGANLDLRDETDFAVVAPLIQVLHAKVVNAELLRVLIQNGTNVDSPCLFNMRPLEHAAMRGHATAVDMLLAADCMVPERIYSMRDQDTQTRAVLHRIKMAASCVMSLQCLCRRMIRGQLGYGHRYAKKIQQLNLPLVLQGFLKYQEL